MKRRKVFLLIECDTTLNTSVLRKLHFLAFGSLPDRRTIRKVWPGDSYKHGDRIPKLDCSGKIVQVQVNVAQKPKAKRSR